MFSKERFGAGTSGPFAAASPGPAEGAAGEQTGAAAAAPPQVLLGRGAGAGTGPGAGGCSRASRPALERRAGLPQSLALPLQHATNREEPVLG